MQAEYCSPVKIMLEFKNSDGHPIDLKNEILSFIEQDHTYQIWLGTDSQVHRSEKEVVYATVVVLYKQGKGGRFFLRRHKGEILRSLRERLMRETWTSIEVGLELMTFLPQNVDLQIHIDSNHSKKWKSGNYTEELVGMVVSQGVKCRIKPEAWAAQTIANKFTK